MIIGTVNKNFFLSSVIEDLYAVGYDFLIFFGLVFYFQFFNHSILMAVIPIVTMYALYSVLVLFSSSLIGKLGTRRAFIGAFLLFSFSTLPFFIWQDEQFSKALVVWLILFVAGKLLYHPSQIMIQGNFSKHKNRGASYSMRYILLTSTSVLVPLVAGLVSERYGIVGLAAVSGAVFVSALIPASYMQDMAFHTNLHTINKMFSSKDIRHLLKIIVVVSGERVIRLFWPLYIFLILKESYIRLGLFLTVVMLAAVIFIWVIGKLLDRLSRERILRKLLVATGVIWLTKAMFTSPVLLAISDMFHKVANRVTDEAYDVVAIDLINDHVPSKDRDEAMLFYEWGVNVTNGLALIFGALIIYAAGFAALFAATGILSFSIVLVKKQSNKESLQD